MVEANPPGQQHGKNPHEEHAVPVKETEEFMEVDEKLFEHIDDENI